MQQRKRIVPRRRPMTALAAAAALGVAGVVAVSTQSPIALTTEETAPAPVADLMALDFDEGIATVLEDPRALVDAITRALPVNSLVDPEDPARIVRRFTSEEEFSLFALTWKGPRDIEAFVRALAADGTWGPWYPALPAGTTGDDGVHGTRMVYLEPTRTVEVSTAPLDDNSPVDTVDTHPVAASIEEEVTDVEVIAEPSGHEAADNEANTVPPAFEPQAEAGPVGVPAIGEVEAPTANTPAVSGVPAIEGDPIAAPGVTPGAFTTPEPVSDPAPVDGQPDVVDAPADEVPPPVAVPVAEKTADPITDVTAVFGMVGHTPPVEGELISLTAGANDWAGIPQPIVNRSTWAKGLPEPSPNCSPAPSTTAPLTAITVQQVLGGSNNYEIRDIPRMMQELYRYDVTRLNRCDISFNAIVDERGGIWEGRKGGLNKAVRADAVPGFDGNTWAIGVLGDFTDLAPTEATLAGVGELAGWRAAVAGIEPTAGTLHTSEGNSLYPKGTPVYVPTIAYAPELTGERANRLGDFMGTIRSQATAHYNDIVSGKYDQQASDEVKAAREKAREEARRKRAMNRILGGGTKEGAGTSALLGLLSSGSSGSSNGSSGSSTVDDFLKKDTNGAVLKIVGSLLALGVGYMVTTGRVPKEVKNLGRQEIIPGMTLAQLPVIITKVIDLGGDTKYSRVWHAANDTFGPVLGTAIGGEHTATNVGERNSKVSWVPFQNGLIVDSPEAGTHPIFGVIGDAWAAQGFDAGPLGMPINAEHPVGDTLLQTDFQGGFITFDTVTGRTEVHTPGNVYVYQESHPAPAVTIAP